MGTKLCGVQRKYELAQKLNGQLESARSEETTKTNNLMQELARYKSRAQSLTEDLQNEKRLKDEALTSLRTQAEEKDTALQTQEHWMGLFNEEYNRKILAYKEANNDFSQQIRALKDDKSHLDDKVQEMEAKNRALEKARSDIERDYINGRKQCEEIQ